MTRVRTTAASLLLVLTFASQASAQAGSLNGSVIAADGSDPIRQATVELVGIGVRITSDAGTFRFAPVVRGAYLLRVSALGYASVERAIEVGAATTIMVELDISPIALDGVPVEVRRIDVRGRVVDVSTGREVLVIDAEVRSDRVDDAFSDSHGRFELEDVPEGAPLSIEIRAFGFLPKDTVVTPAEDDEYRFTLEPDAFVQVLVDTQVRRLEARAVGRRGAALPMARDELLRLSGNSTLLDVLEREYRLYLPRLRCGLIDEQNVFSFGEFRAIVGQLLPEEVERIEFIAGEPPPDEGHLPHFQVRIYTRSFIQEMIAEEMELREPIFISTRSPPICS